MAAHTCFLLEMQENIFSKTKWRWEELCSLLLVKSRFLQENSWNWIAPAWVNKCPCYNKYKQSSRTWETDKWEKSWWSPSNCLLLLIFIGDPFPPLGSRRHTETFLRCLSHHRRLLIGWEPLLAVNSLPEGNLVDLKSGRGKKINLKLSCPAGCQSHFGGAEGCPSWQDLTPEVERWQTRSRVEGGGEAWEG